MLEGIELEEVFRHARSQGFGTCELFVDASLQSVYRIQNRLDSVEIQQTGGIALRCTNGTETRVFLLPHTDTKGILAAMDGEDITGLPSKTAGKGLVFKVTPTDTAANKSRLQQWFRSAFGENEIALKAHAELRQTMHRFYIATSEGAANEDFQESASLRVEWVGLPNAPVSEFERRRHSIREVMEELKDSSSLKEALRKSRAAATFWPAPQGTLPVCYSPKASAQFLLAIVGHFESDRVLSGDSFLNHWPKDLPLQFDLEDSSAEVAGSASDSEAVLHRNFFLFRDGKPRGLACSRKTAQILGVEPTGHVVRNHFRYPGIISLKRVTLTPKQSVSDLVANLEKGILIEDLKAEILPGPSPRIRLDIRAASLIHHGQSGETVEPFEMVCPLAEFLTSFETGGVGGQTFGFSVDKLSQELLSEIHTPALLAPEFPVPGKVPPSHYW